MYVGKEGEVDIVFDGFQFETVLADGIFGELDLVTKQHESPQPLRTDWALQAIDKRHSCFS